jgi:hypothetical protein
MAGIGLMAKAGTWVRHGRAVGFADNLKCVVVVVVAAAVVMMVVAVVQAAMALEFGIAVLVPLPHVAPA